jgi:hypothetical protein
MTNSSSAHLSPVDAAQHHLDALRHDYATTMAQFARDISAAEARLRYLVAEQAEDWVTAQRHNRAP